MINISKEFEGYIFEGSVDPDGPPSTRLPSIRVREKDGEGVLNMESFETMSELHKVLTIFLQTVSNLDASGVTRTRKAST